ncbi:hypothetical protein COCC4DRAFT_124085 [Bipolaris maydis ATCC 48331]|uniref:Uncharacterized protein n=2 Tax=Cochliobolus heterostrophus TaxID=5016 RepID=M2UB80_COCH5|nr:uncharacterized protein COCC4DRAFT_124085 [Bipolaris maydis ATCC 48331]EMD95814.1 hypothetical protein COCHEDRAFT_1126949 [Bipolaris maydis C5]KAH7561719.1 hypothetical protein BM1_02823 [Bipolaris maydis]ENI10675.1 hypothetical protein COCC4DRAFT_124085 [Bipolaris maydis ATCC 48331]KAJ5030537.1 PI31 proteasome regulator N-terminal-domain-containing protein [Bipolaris maydis]KAJ5065548.1 PI31 proteasome regulator N-terminal-domain-containing protein [Bipolaris maydis]
MVQTNTTGNPLSAGSLALFMATSLPKGEASQLKNGTEAVALAVHAGMLAVGFRLIGLGEDERIEAHADAEDPKELPAQWNASSSYAFRYAHAQSAMEFLVKVNRLGGKAVVFALAVGDDKTTHFELTTKDYLSESQLPFSVPEGTSTEDASQKLQDLFISPGRLNDLGSLLKISVIQKLAPRLNKPGYEESTTDQERTPTADRQDPSRSDPPNPQQPSADPDPARPHPFNDPLAAPPRSGRHLPEPIPGFDDELDLDRRPGRFQDNRNPINIGHDDLYPQGLGPNDPLRPHLAGGLPRPGGFGGGGMHPTFDDPLFRGQGGQGGYDPMAPPGARYDTFGPGDPRAEDRGRVPRFPGGGGGGFGGPGGFGGRPPNPFGGFGDGDFI